MNIYDILALREDGEESAPEDTQQEDDVANDDFSIDTSLDDGDNGEETADDMSAPEQSGADDSAEAAPDDSEDSQGGDNAVNDYNTNIFTSLSAEEQQAKIKELKKLFNSLYTSCNEILDRVNNLEADEESIGIISRISSTIYDMKTYIEDYLVFTFPNKSYVENDIAFNRFLLVINSVTEILTKLSKEQEKKEKEDNKKK